MARVARTDVGGLSYHIINRAVGRLKIFRKPSDYLLFISLLRKYQEELGMRVLAFVVMPNHWHLLLYPKRDGDLGEFMHRLTNAHTRKVHTETKTIGTGPLYQGRYKSFIIEEDVHLLTALKYIERNPVRAKLSKICEDYLYGSARLRKYGSAEQKKLLADSPVDLPRNYIRWINEPESLKELEQLRTSIHRNSPFGNDAWVDHIITKYELESTVRSQGRPRKTI